MELAICIAIKNRSNQIVDNEDPVKTYRHIQRFIEPSPELVAPAEVLPNGQIHLKLFPRLLKSLVDIKKDTDKWNIIVVDYGSTDTDIAKLCEDVLGGKIPYIIKTEMVPFFNRGGGLDIAARLAQSLGYNALFFCDTDVYFTNRYTFIKAQQELAKGMFYYPTMFSLAKSDHTVGWWRHTSYGMLFTNTADYFNTARWKNNRTWGHEDRLLHESLPRARVVRETAAGFYHQWHPNDDNFKRKEYEIKHEIGFAACY